VAFLSTNIDNTLVTAALIAGSKPERARRIALGQVIGFLAVVALSAAAAAVLIEFSPRAVGLLGLVPLAIGIRDLLRLRSGTGGAAVTRRAVGSGFTAAMLVTLAAGGDNLAVYIPLFRVGGVARSGIIALVFVLGEVLVTTLALFGGGHPGARSLMARFGVIAVPLLLCAVGVLVLLEANTLSFL
jgi:cadmium resistance protein CadD (predicted permease)